ncbi:uncharacterized protein LOC119305750 [Triticum dicoccoides]|uniref:uncharacterized protein LOC119305750 n=1 Tax=Triticum dicoccoides TaxID=85692 RepID=UPI001890107E|nr:uncharacterized protein LOC119305750 [Triticum dicoccoides]XP_044393277.1 uncharacterized protein LOC123116377 [Triticum aestivum]
MDKKNSVRLIEAIEQLNPEATVKLTQAIEKLIQELKEKSPFDALSERKKSFIEASKAFTLFAGAGLNAMNAFAITLAYMSMHSMNVNADAANTTSTAAPPTESATSPPNMIQSFLILGTMFCFLFTSCATAVAHATVHRTKWFSMLVVIMILEVILLNVTCALYCYLLTEGVFCIIAAALLFFSLVFMLGFITIGFHG